MMKGVVLSAVLLLLAGCATAPVSLCESAFPTRERVALNIGNELNLNLSDMGSDQMNNEVYPPSFGLSMFILSASVSPMPILTITPLLYGPEGNGWLVRAKATMLSNENRAVALIFGGGNGHGEFSELDLWGGGDVGKYSASTLQAGGIYSFGRNDRDDFFYSFNLGPKVIYTYLDYEDYHGEGNEFKGVLWDFGGFFGLTSLKKFGSVGLRAGFEFSAMAVDVPIPRSRELAIRTGLSFGFSF